MALTINPAVSRGNRNWLAHSASFTAGTFFGGLIALALSLLTVALLRTVAPEGAVRVLLAAVVVWAALHDLGLPLPLPYRQRQVPEWLRDLLPPGVTALVYGVMLGVGFLTLFTYSAHLAVLAALPLLGSLTVMLAVIALFALSKSLVLLSAAGASSLEEIPLRFHWTRNRQRLLRATTAAVSLAVAATLLLRA